MKARAAWTRGGLLLAPLVAASALVGCGDSPLEPLVPAQEAATYGPLRVAPVNARYFFDSRGRPVYLTGSNTWNTVQDWGDSDPPPRFDNDAFLAMLRREHHNFTRLYTWEQASGVAWTKEPVWFAPTMYLRTGPGAAHDGGPKFDLTQLNPEYFARLREHVDQARSHGIYVSVMLFNGWSTSRKLAGMDATLRARGLGNPWLDHPFNAANNVNGIDGDPGRSDEGLSVHTLEIPAATELQKAYVRRAIDTLNGFDNVLWEICNECDPGSEPWQYAMIELIKQHEATLPMQHPVGMTSVFPVTTNAPLYAGPADWLSPAEAPDDPYEDDPPARGNKVIIVDTDHLWGIGGNPAWVWKSVARGLNPIYMDPMDAELIGNYPMFRERPRARDDHERTMAVAAQRVRANLGRAFAFVQQITLDDAAPCGIASSGYCLGSAGGGYLIFMPAPDYGWRGLWAGLRRGHLRERVTLDLSSGRGRFGVEWLQVSSGERFGGEPVQGGGRVELSAPFRGDAVLLLRAAAGPK